MLGFTLFSPTYGLLLFCRSGVLLCLFALGGCEQPAEHAGDAQQAPHAQPEPVTSTPPDVEPAQVQTATPAEPPANKPGIESLVLTPQDTPFAEAPARNFGEVPNNDWLATQPRGPARDRLLPDLFDGSGSRDRVNVEGELLLDGSQGTSRMVDGIGVKIEIDTDD